MNKLTESIDYNKALLQEQAKLYKHAIDSYRRAVLQTTPYQSDIYYRMAYLLDKEKKYQQSCEAFLLMDGRVFKSKQNSIEDIKKNQTLLQEYLLEKGILSVEEWLEFAEKSESLNCWSVASYAYKELLAREERFVPKYYTLLGYSLMQEKKYKEASNYFKEQKIIQDIEFNIKEREEDFDYKAYRERFSLEERILVYEECTKVSNRVYEIYLEIDKDAHFDAYRHVWVVDDKKTFSRILTSVNSIIIQKDSDLYKRYLAKAKYIIANRKISSYFKRKEKQFYIFTEEYNLLDNNFAYDVVQEVFFGNKKVAFELKAQNIKIDRLYKKAIEEFNNKKWKSCHEKFLEVKKQATNIKYPLATIYYIKESEFQLKVKTKNIGELLPYEQYKLTAESFIGIDYLLEESSLHSIENREQWSQLRINFLEIIEDIKRNMTENIRSIKDKEFLEKIENLSISFNELLEAEFLPYQSWFLFSHLFIFARLYKKYQLARSKALKSVLNREVVSNREARYKINAMAEINDIEGYNTFREKLPKEDTLYIKENLQFLGASELYFNRHDSSIALYEQIYSKEEKAFAKYIENKTIAIVGPLQSTLDLGEEIDSHDVVLRFNYRGIDKSLKKSNGIKTNLSFYILEILIKDRINATQIKYMNELDWAIYDTGHNKDSICFTGVTTNLRSRYYDAHDYANPYFKGTANGVQRALLDLLRFKIKKIKIYNTNLYLENSYEKNYKSRGSLGADHFNFIWHDPLSNFIFLKRLKEFKIIDTDEVLTKILDLTPDEYIEALEERYGRKIGNDSLNKSSV